MNNKQTPPFWVIIPAAGIGTRMATDKPKQYLRLGSKTILEHTINCFIEHPCLQGIVICLAATDCYWQKLKINHRLILTTIGGKERVNSVIAGLELLQNLTKADDWVLVHDAARPNLQREDLDKLLISLKDDPIGGLLATPAKDTLKQIDSNGRVKATLDRTTVWQALTPQMFRLQHLFNALQQAISAGKTITDEASAMEFAGFAPLLIKGRSDNLKITHPEDLQQLMAYFR